MRGETDGAPSLLRETNVKSRFARILCAVLVGVFAGLLVPAASGTMVSALRGSVGYQTTPGGVALKVDRTATALPDGAVVVTQSKSAALVTLPDTSYVALGADTQAQIGHFYDPSAPAPTAITLLQGALRFNVVHPVNGASNYVVRAPHNASVAIHGTLGLVSTSQAGLTVACLSCGDDDIIVTANQQTYRVRKREALTYEYAGGTVAVGVGTAAALGAFGAAGLSTDASTQPRRSRAERRLVYRPR